MPSAHLPLEPPLVLVRPHIRRVLAPSLTSPRLQWHRSIRSQLQGNVCKCAALVSCNAECRPSTSRRIWFLPRRSSAHHPHPARY
jgi:hypothetical protein